MMPNASPAFDRAAFAAALLDADHALPEGLCASRGASLEDRFAVYRNNVVQGLIDALATRFAAVHRVVGEGFFAAMARLYATRNPPHQPILAFYGESFADFLETFPPAAELPYLADLVRLEAARTRAYHAEDAATLPLDAFAGLLAASDPAHLRLKLHPSVFVLASAHPVATIFAMNMDLLPLAPIDDWQGEEICIARPQMTVEIIPLPKGGAAFLAHLAQGAELAQAASAALVATPDFDLAENLAVLMRSRLATEILAPALSPA